MSDILTLWHVHRDAGWPVVSNIHEGELMTLDTVISGCVVYFLESEEGLDQQRIDMLRSCLDDLNGLLPDLPEESGPYFARLQTLADLLLAANRAE